MKRIYLIILLFPDAKFETYAEAATYQKEYAEYHDYVIVKLDDTYNIYNMEPTN